MKLTTVTKMFIFKLTFFSRQTNQQPTSSNSRNQSPLPGNQQSTEGASLGTIISQQSNSNAPSNAASPTQDLQQAQKNLQVTSPIPFDQTQAMQQPQQVQDQENQEFDPATQQQQQQGQPIPQQVQQQQEVLSPTNSDIALQQQQQQGMNGQQPQHFVFNQQQQAAMQQQMQNQYYMNAAAGQGQGQDPYVASGGIPVVNAQGQTTMIHPQYAAAYGLQQYVFANQGNNPAFIQQQSQQMQSQDGRPPTTTTSTAQQQQQQQSQQPQPQPQQMGGQQQIPAGYQVVQAPMNFQQFYDQHGNPVIINGRMAAPMSQVRMVSPMVLNANGQPTVSPGVASGTSPSVQMYSQQQPQQQQQATQQQQQRPGGKSRKMIENNTINRLLNSLPLYTNAPIQFELYSMM